ncbi:MAG: RsmB/NOP family class I SAM-dependent RNA methyltransferase, partial [Sphingomonadales bacterium]
RGQLAKFKTLADVVVLDVPCSGTGTWRRDPELRLRLSEESLREFTKTQMRLMEEGARLLKPGGRLVYMTCSLLPQENEEQITAFLKKREPWRLLGAQKIWVEALGGDKLKNLSTNLKCFQLTPHSNGTDGFFIGVLKKPNIKGI